MGAASETIRFLGMKSRCMNTFGQDKALSAMAANDLSNTWRWAASSVNLRYSPTYHWGNNSSSRITKGRSYGGNTPSREASCHCNSVSTASRYRPSGGGPSGWITSFMVWVPRSDSSMKPWASSQASTSGTFSPACAIRSATATKGLQSPLSGGASMMMRLVGAPASTLSTRR